MSARLRGLRAWVARHPLGADAALAALLGALFALAALGAENTTAGTWPLIAGLTAPLAFRRRAPLVAFAAVSLAAFVQLLSAEPLLADAALLFALYSVAVHEKRPWGFPLAFAVCEVGALLAVLQFGEGGFLLPFASASAFVIAAGALGVYVRTRREHIAALLLRAQDLERERDRQAQLAGAAERARIARELHDVVAHNLTVMIALADGARLSAERSPAEAGAAMGTVAATGRDALGEMRRLLGVLREDPGGASREGDAGEGEGPGAGQEPGPLRPQPGLDQLDGLLTQVRGTGLPTRLVQSGEPVPLGPGAELTVYRVVQEALTNTLKHAHTPTSAEVRLEWREKALVVEVSDDGAGVGGRGDTEPAASNGAAADGHGLTGMRERAAAYGGKVEVGPRSTGGWGVRTELRLDEACS
jgi:signal transduction histidine kinase